jgi:hypothetical protein
MKYKGIFIEQTPSEKYPQLVTLVKGVKKAKPIMGKQFLSQEHAINFIDKWELQLWEVQTSTKLEKSEQKVAKKELLKLG